MTEPVPTTPFSKVALRLHCGISMLIRGRLSARLQQTTIYRRVLRLTTRILLRRDTRHLVRSTVLLLGVLPQALDRPFLRARNTSRSTWGLCGCGTQIPQPLRWTARPPSAEVP